MQQNKRSIKMPSILFFRGWIESNKQVTLRSKIKSILISLVIGISIAFFIMAITTKNNPFLVFKTIWSLAFDSNMFNYTLGLTSLLLVSGLANAIAFKTGLFNIGVSGQMFFTGVITVLLGLTVFRGLGVMGVVILIWIGAVTGGLVAGFIGWLKARFNVHEVVTSILLNWGLFYIARYIISLMGRSARWGDKVSSASGATQVLPPEFQMSSHYYGYILVSIGIISAILIAIVLWKSTFGHALKVTGLARNNAKYSGININKQIILSMGFSGLAAGVLGVMFYVIQERQIGVQYLSYNELPTIGFQGIAIALLAYSNPIGIIPIAFLFGIFQSGSFGLVQYGIDNSFSNLIVGVMMYFAAISILFMRFKPIRMIYTWIKINKRHYPKEYKLINAKFNMMNEEYKIASAENIILWNNKISILNKELIDNDKKRQKIAIKSKAFLKSKEISNTLSKEIKEYKKHIKDISFGYKSIKRYRNTQIKLLKIKKQREFYKNIHSNYNIIQSDEFIKSREDFMKTINKLNVKNKEIE